MANNKDYNAGYDRANEIIKTTLVNGIDEFQKMSIFIDFMVKIIPTPADVDVKAFVDGVVDAAKEAWKVTKTEEVKELEVERAQVDQDYKAQLDAKRSA